MLKELTNGNYFIYQLRFGGFGIVEGKDEAEAVANVIDAYRRHEGSEYSATDIDCKNIAGMENTFFADKPKVIELGWTIEML